MGWVHYVGETKRGSKGEMKDRQGKDLDTFEADGSARMVDIPKSVDPRGVRRQVIDAPADHTGDTEEAANDKSKVLCHSCHPDSDPPVRQPTE